MKRFDSRNARYLVAIERLEMHDLIGAEQVGRAQERAFRDDVVQAQLPPRQPIRRATTSAVTMTLQTRAGLVTTNRSRSAPPSAFMCARLPESATILTNGIFLTKAQRPRRVLQQLPARALAATACLEQIAASAREVVAFGALDRRLQQIAREVAASERWFVRALSDQPVTQL